MARLSHVQKQNHTLTYCTSMYLRFVHCDTFDVKRNSQKIVQMSSLHMEGGGGVKQFVLYKLDIVVFMIWPVYTISK